MIQPANSNHIAFKDSVVPFILEESDISGRFLRSEHMISRILTQHDYPDGVAQLLGEALLVLGVLGSGMKLQHRMTLQVKGDGAISMLMAEITHEGHMRGYVQFDKEMLARWTGGEAINPFLLFGKGYIALTVDNGANTRPYQGIVAIEGKSLAGVVLKYLEQSEQIMSSLVVHFEKVEYPNETAWRGAVMLIQKMGKSGDDFKIVPIDAQAQEDWNRVCALFHTATKKELLDVSLDDERLLYRLFHEENVIKFDKVDLKFGCSCSRERLLRFLSTLPPQELEEMQAEDSHVGADCQMCGQKYQFEMDEIKESVL